MDRNKKERHKGGNSKDTANKQTRSVHAQSDPITSYREKSGHSPPSRGLGASSQGLYGGSKYIKKIYESVSDIHSHSDSNSRRPTATACSSSEVLVLYVVDRLINVFLDSVHREPAVSGNVGDAL